jgi:hypothetical protein
MNTLILKQLIDRTSIEADRLLSSSRRGDPFLAQVKKNLDSCKASGYITTDESLEALRLLGQAAVRTYDSFDSVPKAKDFVNSATELSRHLAA